MVLSMDGIYWEDSWYSSRIKPVTRQRKQKFLSGDAGDVVLRPVDFAMRKNQDSEMSGLCVMSALLEFNHHNLHDPLMASLYT